MTSRATICALLCCLLSLATALGESPLRAQGRADLSRVQQHYDRGRYEAAAQELQGIAKDRLQAQDRELLSWMARVNDRLNNGWLTYYYSSLLYLTDDRPSTLWDAPRHVLGAQPDRASIILDLQSSERKGIPSNIVNGVLATAVYVQATRTLSSIKGPLDKNRFAALEQLQDGIAEVMASGRSDDFDLVVLLAKCRFYMLMVDVDLRDNLRKKQDLDQMFPAFTRKPDGSLERVKIGNDAPVFLALDEATNRLVLARYGLMWTWLEPMLNILAASPDVLALGGELSLDFGVRTRSDQRIRSGLALLRKAQALKPSPRLTELINRAQSELKSPPK